MPQQAWTEKRERRHEHVRRGLLDRGRPEDESDEIAARVVNKEGASSGEAEESSDLSETEAPPGRRGGLRSGTSRPRGRTRDQLYEEAKALGIPGRSKMDKDELQRAVDKRRGRR